MQHPKVSRVTRRPLISINPLHSRIARAGPRAITPSVTSHLSSNTHRRPHRSIRLVYHHGCIRRPTPGKTPLYCSRPALNFLPGGQSPWTRRQSLIQADAYQKAVSDHSKATDTHQQGTPATTAKHFKSSPGINTGGFQAREYWTLSRGVKNSPISGF